MEGAEAKIYEKKGNIVKERIQKKYRIKELDLLLRKTRTNREAKVLKRLYDNNIDVPKLIEKENFTIVMEKISGHKLRDVLEKENYMLICKELGKIIKKVHDLGIIHGDLTTSNLIYTKNKIYLIDFGLSFFSHKIEDKAVDLHLLRKALESKHYKISKKCFNQVLKSYNDKEILQRLSLVELRGRNKNK